MWLLHLCSSANSVDADDDDLTLMPATHFCQVEGEKMTSYKYLLVEKNDETHEYFRYYGNLSVKSSKYEECILCIITTYMYIYVLHEYIWKRFDQDKTEIEWLPKLTAYLNPCRAECMQNHNKSFLASASWRTKSRSHCIKQSVSVLHHLSYWGMCLVYPIYRLPDHQGPSVSLFTLHYISICTACKALPFQILIENSALRDANLQLKLRPFI